jgi:uncharacterized protein YjbJ (UPF0337 family)
MNSDTIEGNWKQMMGDVQKQWGKLTNDHLTQIEGNRKKLAGAIQKNYGILQDEAEKQIADWESTRRKMTDNIIKTVSK